MNCEAAACRAGARVYAGAAPGGRVVPGRMNGANSMKNYFRFAGRVTAGHVVTYAGVGVLAYALVTGEFLDGSNELVKRLGARRRSLRCGAM